VSDLSQPTGLAGAFMEHRERLLRFLVARGAGEAAEDLLHEIWLKVSRAQTGPVADPLAYLFRTANLLMIDRYRSETQARKRERDWSEAMAGTGGGISDSPSAERQAIASQLCEQVTQTLDELGERQAAIFRRHRVDGIPQRQVAAEFGVSLSTVESDLRSAYRALAELKERLDEA